MHVIVCAKQVPGIPPVISVFDERAVELACRLKEKYQAQITAITMGPGKVSDVVKHALAMGADEAVILQDAAFEDSDSFGTAYILSQAIKKIGNYDLILCGRQAADWDTGQTGPILGEILGISIVTVAKDIEVENSKIKVTRVLDDGLEVVESPIPCLVTVSNEVGLPRLPSGMGIIKAARKQVPTWTAQDIDADPTKIGIAGAHTEVSSLFVPVRDTTCMIITADSAAEAAVKLAMKLRETKVI